MIRFAPYELDIRAAELRKHGVRLRLPRQSFRVLLMLLEYPGEVVLREEIRAKLWPNGTVVEFDHSINAAVKQIRVVLSDSAENPRYIETVGRQGYRFIGRVDSHSDSPPPRPPTQAADPDAETVSHFRILRTLGEGAMGKVCLAEDLKLGRRVALKFLALEPGDTPPALLERFRREARAAAVLSHPNICAVFGVEEHEGRPVIVMEFVEGETLAARLERGALKLDEALAFAMQITGALEEAHRKGVVHRDLKPANVMIGKSGVKVLDFGLAKIECRAVVGDETHTLTAEGTILGTVQYMSPEQAQGKDADARSDIFSFGLVLYEMITGRRAFEGSNAASIIAAILEREPPVLESEGLNRVVQACLAKEPDNRFQSARDLRRAFEWGVSGEHAEGAPEHVTARRPWLGWAVAAVTTLGLALVTFLHFRETPPALAAPVRFQIQTTGKLNGSFSLSPDGRKVAFVVGGRLWVHFLESGESRDLTAAELLPFWSPDSRVIGYSSQGKVMKIEAAGGTPQTVVAGVRFFGGGAWSRDGVIVFADGTLFRVPASGGTPVAITASDPAGPLVTHRAPAFLPDGRHFVYSRHSADARSSAIFLGAVYAKPEQQSSTPLVFCDLMASYAPSADSATGYLVFIREGTLMAQPFDSRRLELRGQAVPIADGVFDNGSRLGVFSVSPNGVLAFVKGTAPEMQLTWYDREGRVLGTVGELGDYLAAVVSPDGTRVAVSKTSGQGANIWLLDLRDGASTRFTISSARDTYPAWSPDGSRIIFSSNRNGQDDLYQKPADGMRDEELLLRTSEFKHPASWSRDGRFLLYQVMGAKIRGDIWVLPMQGDRRPVPFLITDENALQARFSPDGHWVAYSWNGEPNRWDVYVQPFSVDSAGNVVAGGKRQISDAGGSCPRWRGDGRELYYRSNDGGVMAVEISTNPSFRAGKPQRVGPLPDSQRDFPTIAWDASADGKFLMAARAKGRPESFTVVLNWQAGLKK